MPPQLEGIERYFNEYFDHWSITLPRDALTERRGGHIFKNGWHIGFIWGAEDDDEYLEFLAQHRMTNDRHVRVFESGRVESLETAPETYVIPADATPEERESAGKRNADEHRRISAELREKGLLPPAGENLGAMEINEYLRSGEPGEADAD